MAEMGKRRLNNWRWWLPSLSLGLLIFASLAPLSDTWHDVVALLASGGLLVYLFTDSPASRTETARFLVSVTALVLLALLLSIDPRWVIFGSLGVYVVIALWGVLRQEHAEYLAERERPS